MITEIFAKEKFKEDEQWIVKNLLLETQMGSYAYGCQTENSDVDLVGIVMDRHQCLFPQQYGFILGFDNIPTFNNVEYKGESNRIILDNRKTCEGVWHSLTNFFSLVENGSPSLTEVLFARRNMVLYGHKIGFMLRDNRKMFLSMKMFHSFKGYAFMQLKRIRNHVKEWNEKKTCDNNNRREYFEKFGYDVKQAYHCLRLIDLIDQLIKIGDLDLMRDKEECKAMRNGEWGNWEKFENYVSQKLIELETYVNTNPVAIPLRAPHEPLHELLTNLIEEYYGSEGEMKKQKTEYITAKSVMSKLEEINSKIDKISVTAPYGVKPKPFWFMPH